MTPKFWIFCVVVASGKDLTDGIYKVLLLWTMRDVQTLENMSSLFLCFERSKKAGSRWYDRHNLRALHGETYLGAHERWNRGCRSLEMTTQAQNGTKGTRYFVLVYLIDTQRRTWSSGTFCMLSSSTHLTAPSSRIRWLPKAPLGHLSRVVRVCDCSRCSVTRPWCKLGNVRAPWSQLHAVRFL